MWRKVRIAVLLLILLFVALDQYFDRVYSRDWDLPLRVAVFPINADGSDVAQKYIDKLAAADLERIERFFNEEAERHGLKLRPPIRMQLAPIVRERPPGLERGAGWIANAWWSLRSRYWAWRNGDVVGARPDIRLFALYHDPALSPRLPHSVGLQKGLYAIAHVFANAREAGSNDIVMAHELLHTLGATDKYERDTSLPRFPGGYAEPEREPRYPQRFAELMAGRTPTSPTEAEIPESLDRVLIGWATALEIGWETPR
jgi:hypothetical protein